MASFSTVLEHERSMWTWHQITVTQLTAANVELQKVYKAWNLDKLTAFGATKGMEWQFIPVDAPWQNGALKALVKSGKQLP